MEHQNFSYDELALFATDLLNKVGFDEYSLNSVVVGLCEASLRGVDSHGIRLLPHYVTSALHGRKNPRPNFKLTQKFCSFALLDADNGFGLAAGMRAMDVGMDIADLSGIAAVSVVNSSHPGAMASIALRASRKGYIAMAFTHADSLLRSFGGQRAYFGTNPICFSAPSAKGEPFCLDMATSVIPWNRLISHREKSEPLAMGIAADQRGVETTDPNLATTLLPFGGYKGFCLSAMVEVLCGVLSGMAFGRSIPKMYGSDLSSPRKLGQFYIVMRTDIAMTCNEFESRMMKMSEEVNSEPTLEGVDRVLMPGDREVDVKNSRSKSGIPVDEKTMHALNAIARVVGVKSLSDY